MKALDKKLEDIAEQNDSHDILAILVNFFEFKYGIDGMEEEIKQFVDFANPVE